MEHPKAGEATVGENPDVVAALSRLPPIQPAPQAPQSTVAGPVSPQTAPVPGTYLQSFSPPCWKTDGYCRQEGYLFALGILVGLLIGWSQWLTDWSYQT